jgi:hypothetical protein
MSCYYCEENAQGQCQTCGRFICRKHSDIHNSKMLCADCEAGDLGVYQTTRNKLLKVPIIGQCGVAYCRKPLYESSQYEAIGSAGDVLGQAVYDGLLKEFKHLETGYRECPEKCLTCHNHRPRETDAYDKITLARNKHVTKTCKVCNKTWTT